MTFLVILVSVLVVEAMTNSREFPYSFFRPLLEFGTCNLEFSFRSVPQLRDNGHTCQINRCSGRLLEGLSTGFHGGARGDYIVDQKNVLIF